MSVTNQLTVMEVIKPSTTIGVGVLSQAKEKQRENAAKALGEFAGTVLATASSKLTTLDRQKAALLSQLKALEAETEKISKAAAVADSESNLFPLAAVIGLKSAATRMAAAAGLVVPANDDPIWNLPV